MSLLDRIRGRKAESEAQAVDGDWLVKAMAADVAVLDAPPAEAPAPAPEAPAPEAVPLAAVPSTGGGSTTTTGEVHPLAAPGVLDPLRARHPQAVLAEVFDYSHGEVAEVLGREEAACRQLVHRARQHVTEGRPRI